MKRTFLAIRVHANNSITDCYNHFAKELSAERVNWVAANHFHLTLCFLGDTSDLMIRSITNQLRSLSARISPVTVVIRGCGVFPTLVDPAVLWFGIEDNHELLRLKQELDKLFEKLGFPFEKKRFRPHLTFGRIKQIKKREKLINLLKQYEGQLFMSETISECTFFESQLSSSGPVYSVIEEFPLAVRDSNESSRGKE